ncbi:MAG: TIGR04076 family protein [Candidatus Odinarchaeota archaeon]|nr:TIGR04076 family protein [Candidatus Odinarchaeota archaeon]
MCSWFKSRDEIDLTIPCLPEDYKEWKKKPKICPHLLTCITPQILILQGGGKIPWEDKEDEATVMCPDPKNTVTLVIKRIKK